ncbi:ATP-grasp fold amidoligase family protein [Microcoleus sp. F10-C6]|uniref:ATP-grasp fold amidoligase family protein n=1 Tax=unclassified Microcoleus TaxID=2642155 RepID=UPI002FD3661A
MNPKVFVTRGITFGEWVGKSLKRRGWGRLPIGRVIVDILLWPSDCFKIHRKYRHVFGQRPKLLSPPTFNEKLQYRKLFCRQSIYTVFADKIAVRDYVKQRLGSDVLTKLYWNGTDLRKVAKESLPEKFVIKANHACGTNLIVENRYSFDWCKAYEQTQAWLQMDYSDRSAEWQYRWIPPTLLIEEFLQGSDGKSLLDYKFFCFRGRVEMVDIHVDRFSSNRTRAFVDRNFKILDLSQAYPRYRGELVKPTNFTLMIDMAETLASEQPFLRVDFYDIGRPIFGELTLNPHAGMVKFNPPEYDYKLGQLML